MNDRSLACFAAAERTGSFSVAAWELSTTQQNVSYTIRKLEDELGFPLFVRRASRVELTAGGELFLRWYTEFDRAVQQAAREVGVPGGTGGSVTDVQIRCFLAAAERETLTDAAESLFYAPQTFAGILSALEKALGTRLFDRVRGQLRLTDSGAAYLSAFCQGAEAFADMAAAARARYAQAQDCAVVGMSEWLSAEGPLGQVVRAFSSTVELCSMDNQSLLDALEVGSVDVALWSDGHAPVNRGLDITELQEEDMCLFVPADGRACPVLVCPGWPRSFIENRVISTQENVFQDFTPMGTVLVEALSDLLERLASGQYAAVGDRRFGRLGSIPGLRVIPLGQTTHIVACRRSNAGDDCGARLTAFLKEHL